MPYPHPNVGKCISQHRVLYIDQWTPLGAFVTCAVCGHSFHADNTLLGEHYLAFQYISPAGPLCDKGLFVYNKEMEGR